MLTSWLTCARIIESNLSGDLDKVICGLTKDVWVSFYYLIDKKCLFGSFSVVLD